MAKAEQRRQETAAMKSLLYHAFGVRAYRYLRTRYEGGQVIFELEPEIGKRLAGDRVGEK